MPDTLFISYKSEENPFALQLAAALKNHGVNVWIDRLDIKPSDHWETAIDIALKSSTGLVAVITPNYLTSRYGRAELLFAFDHDLPIFPLLLRSVEKDAMPFWLPSLQWLDFSDYYSLDDAAYQRKLEILLTRIEAEQRGVLGDLPSAEIQYLTTLIADLESQQGVENYIAFSAQSEVVRVDPRPRKNIEPSLALLLNPATPERDLQHETQKIDNIQQAIADHSRFVLIGDPGAGKTTTLRRLALETARARLEGLKTGDITHPLPFLVYLPLWSAEPTAADFIRRQWASTHMGGDVVRELQYGHVRLYLDGLNEMGGEGKNKAALLREWLQSPDGPRHAIITCRQGDYHSGLRLGDIPTVLVEPLTDEKIREFAVQYLGEGTAGTFLEKVLPSKDVRDWELERVKRRSLIHLARNPYLLAALTMIYEFGGDLPRNTGALFQQLAKVLWERERLRHTLGWIPFEQMQAAFGNLAFSMIDEDQPIDVPLNYAEAKLGNMDFLHIGRSANLIAVNGSEVRFQHQLTLEYFAAVGLLNVGVVTQLQRPQFIIGRKATKWDKVVVASCGLLLDPSLVVNQIVDIDAFLAADCLSSGIETTRATHEKVTTSLLVALHDTHRDVRLNAALALGTIGDPAAVPALLGALYDDDSVVRSGAADALGNIGNPAAVPALLVALHDAGSDVRSFAAEALGKLGDPATLPALLEALHDADSDVRSFAAEALGKLGGPTAIAALLDALHDSDRRVRSTAAQALGNIGNPVAVPALIERLTDAEREPFMLDLPVCDYAAHALEKIGTPEALEAVRRWRQEQDNSDMSK